MDDKQRLRNMLSDVEDDARTLRNKVKRESFDTNDIVKTLNLIAHLTQIVREDIVQ